MWELDCKEAERQIIDAFQLWCWRRLLRVPWTARRSNQSILKDISPLRVLWKDWCWNWNSNILATWCKELTHLKIPWCWERLKVGGEGDNRGWGGLDGHGFGWTLEVGDGQGGLACCGSWGRKESDTTERLNWTEPWITYLNHISVHVTQTWRPKMETKHSKYKGGIDFMNELLEKQTSLKLETR